MNTVKRRSSCVILSVVLMLSVMLSSSIAFAGNDIQTGSSLLDDLEVSYSMDGVNVVENTSFTDVDGSAVNILRAVQPNGIITAQVVVNGVAQQVPTMVRADYDAFYALANSISLPTPYLVAPSPRAGGCIAGSQYRHLFCASNVSTITRTQADTLASIVLGFVGIVSGPVGGIIAATAAVMYTAFSSGQAASSKVTDTFYQVDTPMSDGRYLFVCYCHHIKTEMFDSAGHRIGSTMYDYWQSNSPI